MLEKYIERRLVSLVKSYGGICIKLDASLYKGIPDRMILTATGRVKFVELKNTGKQLREVQKVWRDKLISMGFDYEVIDSYEKVDSQKSFLTATK